MQSKFHKYPTRVQDSIQKYSESIFVVERFKVKFYMKVSKTRC